MAVSISELLTQKEALDRQILEAQQAAKADAIARVRSLMAEHRLTAADLAAAPKRQHARAGAKVAPKYRDPVSGLTWSGRGLRPRWMVAALESGGRLEDFAI
jgi:DNA-binding protein H-NS